MNTNGCWFLLRRLILPLAVVGLMTVVSIPAFAANPTVSNVTAAQRYPWNGKVDISFNVSGSFSQPVQLKVSAVNQTSGTTYTADKSALSGDTVFASGTHRVVWDLNAQGIAFKSDNVVFSVVYESLPIYCVIDLSGGASASSYPVTYMDEPPSGGFNTDTYKTTKLVLRLIPPGTSTLGSSDSSYNNSEHQVTFTNSFYCGLFEVTQKQYELVKGVNPVDSINPVDGQASYPGDRRAVVNVSWETIRGSATTYNWPSVTTVASSSFVGRIRARTGLNLDLPTSDQWEYACHAGTTSAYNNGGNSENDLKQLGRYEGNESDGKGGYDHMTVVGSYLPNAWGLYDMHGNASEWCLDGSPQIRDWRGGSFKDIALRCASFYSAGGSPSYSGKYVFYLGFRLVATLSQ